MNPEVKRWLESARIGDMLGVLRSDKSLTITELARLMETSRSRASLIENNRVLPRPEEVEAWARACDAKESQVKELVALAAEGRTVHLRFTRKGAAQQQVYTDHAKSSDLVTEFDHVVLPAPLQTSDYSRAVLTMHSELGLIEQDEEQIAEGVAERQRRHRLLVGSAKPSYHFVIMETVLDLDYVGIPGAMATQLHRVREAMQLDHVTIGFIPTVGVVPAIAPTNSFVYYNPNNVLVETCTGDIRHEAPAPEVGTYLGLMARLNDAAVFGDEALAMIESRLP